jgi:hypothetical protein
MTTKKRGWSEMKIQTSLWSCSSPNIDSQRSYGLHGSITNAPNSPSCAQRHRHILLRNSVLLSFSTSIINCSCPFIFTCVTPFHVKSFVGTRQFADDNPQMKLLLSYDWTSPVEVHVDFRIVDLIQEPAVDDLQRVSFVNLMKYDNAKSMKPWQSINDKITIN